MKYRESGMPSEQLWDTLFSPEEVINKMEIDNNIRTLLDIGCGYGTFLFPMAKVVGTKVVGIDIEKEMIETCNEKIKKQNILNIELIHGDISKDDIVNQIKNFAGIDYVTLFNILHCEEPVVLLQKVYSVLSENGKVGVIHWIHGETPRGPSLDIRPKSETIIEWATQVGFIIEKQVKLPPYHFGIIFKKAGVIL